MKIAFVALFAFGSIAVAQAPPPRDGFVPNEAIAVKLAEAILAPIYGAQKVESERPFRATLAKGIWTIEGTVHTDDGGAARIQIDKRTAAVVSYIHFK